MSDDDPDEDRQQEVLNAVLKFLGITLGIALFIALVTYFAVSSLNLNTTNNSAANAPDPLVPITALPTTAVPQPATSPTPTDTISPTEYPVYTPSPGSTDLVLAASPVIVNSMDRINLTGNWPGHDNVSLLVERFEGGRWVDFGVQLQVQVGTFATYVQTGTRGDNRFRVYDPASKTASNDVHITVQ